MKKKIILFGYGVRGRKFLDCYLEQGGNFEIMAIADNHKAGQVFGDIPVIAPKNIPEHEYDEIWLCTQSDNEDIRNQLTAGCGIEAHRIIELDTPLHLYILDERIRKKYHEEITGNIQCADPEKQEVIHYLKDHKARMYCYPFYDDYMRKEPPVFWDGEYGLFYVLYMSKRMYLARRINTAKRAGEYFNFICMEQSILSPHRYMTADFPVCHGGTGMDIGAAEGIFALGIIDKVDFMYLIETDKEWLEALKLTFSGYQDKVRIIESFVSDADRDGSSTIDSILEGNRVDFIKMDIEGEELNALKGARNTLAAQKARLAVCAYHHQDDYDMICHELGKYGYHVKPSKGYLICVGEWEKRNKNADFRRAIAFAEKEGQADEIIVCMHTEL